MSGGRQHAVPPRLELTPARPMVVSALVEGHIHKIQESKDPRRWSCERFFRESFGHTDKPVPWGRFISALNLRYKTYFVDPIVTEDSKETEERLFSFKRAVISSDGAVRLERLASSTPDGLFHAFATATQLRLMDSKAPVEPAFSSPGQLRTASPTAGSSRAQTRSCVVRVSACVGAPSRPRTRPRSCVRSC